MAKYRKVDPRIWNDTKFRTLSDNGKLAFLFLLTHPHMTSLGAMRATIPGLASEVGWTEKAFREAFAEALAKGMAEHDPEACFVGLPRFLKYNPPESPNVVKSWDTAYDLIPECPLKVVMCKRVKGFLEGFAEGFAKGCPASISRLADHPLPNQEQEQEQEPEQDGANAPTSPEVASDSGRVLMEFPVVGGKVKVWAFRESHADQLAEAFPGVDVVAQSRKALGWLMANPKKTKTPAGMPKFLFGWMERNQNSGGSVASRGSPPSSTARPENQQAIEEFMSQT
jgi:hypothetical protein